MADSIVRFDGDDGIEILIDTATGESFASVSGYARMSKKAASTISRRLKTVALDDQKTAEILTASGLKTVALIGEKLICKWLPKDNPEAAESLLQLGVRIALHKMAGYQVVSTAVAPSTKVFSLEMVIRREPMEWERMFSSEWIKEAERLTGWRWNWKVMSTFIVSTVYAYLPCDVVMTLRQMNPKDGSGNRSYKHHQFLQPEVRKIVSAHLNTVEDLMKAAKGNLSLFEMLSGIRGEIARYF